MSDHYISHPGNCWVKPKKASRGTIHQCPGTPNEKKKKRCHVYCTSFSERSTMSLDCSKGIKPIQGAFILMVTVIAGALSTEI